MKVNRTTPAGLSTLDPAPEPQVSPSPGLSSVRSSASRRGGAPGPPDAPSDCAAPAASTPFLSLIRKTCTRPRSILSETRTWMQKRRWT